MTKVPNGLLIAAPSSGAGKTTLTLSLLRASKAKGHAVVSAKSGPDYIDPRFHAAATGAPCINLDAWAMSSQAIRRLANQHAAASELLLIEGAMGLFDGAANGRGSAADLAACLQVPVVLVVDCSRQAQSVAALVSGFGAFRTDVSVAGIVLNRVGSARHEAMLRTALAPLGIPVVGALPRLPGLQLPERHLGLVQAGEHPDLEAYLNSAAELCLEHMDLPALLSLGRPLKAPDPVMETGLAPLGQRIAVASDNAFAFSYPHTLDDWRQKGAELSFFSPLSDNAPDPHADAVFLPGGYPELHAERLAAATAFRAGIYSSVDKGALIYGECGGYMTLGEVLVDAQGKRHNMLGLLPLETSFEARKRQLGYRTLKSQSGFPWKGALSAHEFHYATIVREGGRERLFRAHDAEGTPLPDMGLRQGSVMGSFAHVIARMP
ncbi:cobyrinic acid a,c-diamide synthase [Roseibium hamelinense]|uniref:Hydrogenobyrinate a,c-diamide synthase n=1 Tax=Roseibium hamelinense TaxID=150831 RepID=A0A562T0K5_9HYPH|nr:cobyrinate a,c-diamide synthase [Roseibium hamelinense]MTI43846.1 cobyrinate a,c-diamide synthase [Roseibium hamelinense]TWI87069.1 cobyrinic acid a,c-diamide synthase [Roseibium hamelinense]